MPRRGAAPRRASSWRPSMTAPRHSPRRCGAAISREEAGDGHSEAVAAVANRLARGGAAMLALPADIPLVRPADIARLIAAGELAPAFAIVPARDGRGSNAVLCAPAGRGAAALRRRELFAASRGGAGPGACAGGAAIAAHRPRHRRWRRSRRLPRHSVGYARTGADRMPRHHHPSYCRVARMTALDQFRVRAPCDAEALALAECAELAALMDCAAALRDVGHGAIVTVSRKVFIPLTQLCRDACHYCTFAHPPRRGEDAPISRRPRCWRSRARAPRPAASEALFTLGDKPELRYRRRARRARRRSATPPRSPISQRWRRWCCARPASCRISIPA